MNTKSKQKGKSNRRARRIRNVIIVVVIVAAILTGLVLYAQRMVAENFATTDDTIESAEVTVGSISTTVSGSGTLASEGVEDVTFPSSVTLDTIYVEEGDTVSEGDLLASVDAASVLSAMASAQASLDALDEEIEAAAEDEADEEVTTALDGRVKVIYAEEDDDVATVMYENGALLLLSLDGYMAVDVDAGDLAVGDSVTVTDSDGNEYDGTVDAVASVATVLIDDDSAAYGDTVTVTDSDGSTVGTGTLYIHEELKVTGYAGTVEEVEVDVDDAVDAGDTLLTLTDTAYSANYDSLLKERAELEETLQELIALYKQGAVYATLSGVVDSISYSTGSTSSSMGSTFDTASATTASSSDGGETTLLSIAPDETMTVSLSVDETDILSLEVGQEAAITIDSIGTDSYTGTVTEIDTTATSSGGVTQYTVTVTLDKTDSMLSGMSASVTITIEGVENALLLPVDAVTQTSSTAYVYTSYDETTGELGDMVEVTVGLSNSSYIEITDGLSEGDTVYYDASGSSDSSDFSSMFGDMSSRGGDMDFSSMGGGNDTSGFSGGGDTGGFSGGNAGGGMPG
ncbi:MAG: HlyD family efflux transporter periplasmic adaptor subunit [Clostridiales bacterium]|nr:HlyD family efflux transporter periplasmic adaptor subunit [Clostridiales bacterium]